MNKTEIDYSKIYSPYKLGIFDQCPRQYQYYYLDPFWRREKYNLMKQPENIWSFQTLGKAVHNAITLFYHLPKENRTEKSLLEGLRETWRSERYPKKGLPLGKLGGFKSVEKERSDYREAQKMLKNFFKMRDPAWKIRYLPTDDFPNSIKDYKELIAPLNVRFDISGKFDLIVREERKLHVIDFKTGKNKENNNFQLRFYKILAEENFSEPVKKASFYFLKSKTENPADLETNSSQKIKKEIITKIESIKKTEIYKARPSKLCDYCLFRNICSKEKGENTPSQDLPF